VQAVEPPKNGSLMLTLMCTVHSQSLAVEPHEPCLAPFLGCLGSDRTGPTRLVGPTGLKPCEKGSRYLANAVAVFQNAPGPMGPCC